MKKTFIWIGSMVVALTGVSADYSSLNGLQGASLKEGVKKIALPHTEISYGDKTWDAFAISDVRMIDGREAWWDMYSNRLVYVASGHSGMNIEHAVANSWWGGNKNAAYKDLHHLNPSDADANNRKNNNPLGVIEGTPTWTNGLTNIGRPASGYGGGASSVFEPADEYKGDFARAYFYIFTLYDDIAWEKAPACMYNLTSYPTLLPWAYEMLLDWAAADPVDLREAERNQKVASIQGNDNPFVSIPGLAEYIWGDKNTTPFNLEEATVAPVANRPEAPSFGEGNWQMAGVNVWTGRWWDSFILTLQSNQDADIYYTLTDSDEYQLYEGGIRIGEASLPGQTIEVKAYAMTSLPDGKPWRSSIATLTLTAMQSGTTDYMHARWQPVEDGYEVNENDIYILTGSKTINVMGSESASTSSSAYIKAAGVVEPDNSGIISILPEGAGIVKFVSDGGDLWYVSVNNLQLEHQGFMLTNEAKKVSLAAEGRAASVNVEAGGIVKIDFGTNYGILQYNAQSPRFSVYTSTQQALTLYRCIEQSTSIYEISVPDPATERERIFTLEGIEVSSADAPGLYLIVNPGRKTKKIIVR